MPTQTDLRPKILAARDTLEKGRRLSKSRQITELLLGHPFFRSNASMVMAFASFKSEVNTFPLMETLLADGVPLHLPRSLPSTKSMEIYRVESLDCLVPGYCGIPEPDPERCTKTEPERITCVLVPGSVFDKNGERMGYGGGFYDRFLRHQAPQAFRIGLAFAMQIVDRLTPQPHDEKMDMVVTEDGILTQQTTGQ